jgi:hypothetical protein
MINSQQNISAIKSEIGAPQRKISKDLMKIEQNFDYQDRKYIFFLIFQRSLILGYSCPRRTKNIKTYWL